MPVLNREGQISRKVSHYREIGRGLDRFFKQTVVARPANLVEEHCDDPQILIKPRIPRDHGCGRAGHGAPVNDEEHRRL